MKTVENSITCLALGDKGLPLTNIQTIVTAAIISFGRT